VSEEHNERPIFEGGKSYDRTGGDRRKVPRRKTDLVITILKYLAAAVLAALLVKYLG
jgi:hypothetical protein